MRAVTQLIQLFWQRRTLTAEQADYLVRQGFVRPEDLPGLNWSEGAADEFTSVEPVVLPPDRLDEVAERLAGHTMARRGRRKPAGRHPGEAKLVAAVGAALAARADALDAFRAWAARFGAAADWPGALAAARRAPAERFAAGLADGLRERAIPLRTLWDALDVGPLLAVADQPDLRGPAARAYRLLLTARRPPLPRHGVLLRHMPLRAARGVAGLHRRLLAALAGLSERRPKLLAAALDRDAPAAAFWALTLVYNARRQPPGGPVVWGREYGPLRPPGAAVWRAAWSAARLMDPPAAARLWAACDAGGAAPDPLRDAPPLHCPRGWRAPAAE